MNYMPGVDELIATFKEKFGQTCVQIYEYGLKKHEERVKEVSLFWDCFNEAKDENKEQGSTFINDFLKFKKEVRRCNTK